MFEPPLESVSKGRIDNQIVAIAYSKYIPSHPSPIA